MLTIADFPTSQGNKRTRPTYLNTIPGLPEKITRLITVTWVCGGAETILSQFDFGRY